jgi:hypothetical protein
VFVVSWAVDAGFPASTAHDHGKPSRTFMPW